MAQSGVPTRAITQPAAWPTIRRRPLVVAAGIGKVSSEAKFMPTGEIGTRPMPRIMIVMPVIQMLPVGIVIMEVIPQTKVVPQMSFSERENL